MKKFQSLILFMLFAYSFNAVANDTIRFTLTYPYYSYHTAIAATNGKQFTIDWGDGSEIETKTGTGNIEEISHDYGNGTIDYTVTIARITADCLFLELTFIGTHLIDLDIRACKSLESLTCYQTLISSLDLSNNKALTYLDCSMSSINSLDLSNNTALEVLYCYETSISNLDLSNNKALGSLSCSKTHITSLDLSNNTALTTLDFSETQIANLDLSKNQDLTYIGCFRSQINSLDLSNNTALETLYCWGSKITSLDLRNNTVLVDLVCYTNYLSSLNLSNNTAFKVLFCDENRLLLSNLYNIAQTMGNPQYVSLGKQALPFQTIEINEPVDYSDQKEFGGIATVFTVEKDGAPATLNDYTILDGIITFKTNGNYKITMTNAAIGYNAEVTANFIVPLDISENMQEQIGIVVYPNPTTGELRIENGKLRIKSVEIYNIVGQKQKMILHSPFSILNSIDISHFPVGIYIVKVITEDGIFVKKIIKK